MNIALQLLEEIASHGGKAVAHGDKLQLSAPHPLPRPLLDTLRAHKPEIMAALRCDSPPPPWTLPVDMAAWPEEARDWYEERAGILEYDAALPRKLAEQRAEAMTREHFERGQLWS